MRVAKQSTAVLMLALELLGDKGEHWIKGDFDDRNGNFCMVGAVDAAGEKLRSKDHMGHIYLRRAVGRAVPEFNDRKCRSFADVRAMFHRAIALSLMDPQLTLPWLSCEPGEPAVTGNSPCLVSAG